LTQSGISALLMAAESNAAEAVALLLAHDPTLVKQVNWNTGETALHRAVWANAADATAVLLAGGAVPTAVNNDGATPATLGAINGSTAALAALPAPPAPAVAEATVPTSADGGVEGVADATGLAVPAAGSAVEADLFEGTDEEHAAAAKIQAGFRGLQVRKEMKTGDDSAARVLPPPVAVPTGEEETEATVQADEVVADTQPVESPTAEVAPVASVQDAPAEGVQPADAEAPTADSA
jgi:hypothetical protein